MADNTAPASLAEKIYKVPGATKAYRTEEWADKGPVQFTSIAIMPTPAHIRAGMEANDNDCPETIGVAGILVDGKPAALVILSAPLTDQLLQLAEYLPFSAAIEKRKSKAGYSYYQAKLD